MSLAPLVLFTYARPEHTRRTLESLASNALANQSDLIVYSDAARGFRDENAVREVRALIRNVKGFRSVILIERSFNYGLSRNIIDGVTETLAHHERVIVLEDDMLTSPYFLTYMNEALERYADDDRVISIHGYLYPVQGSMPEVFFLPGADCWGWATWRRGWACFNPNGAQLLQELKRRRLEYSFDFDGSYPYTRMLKEQIEGKNDSWAIRWYASAFLLGKLTLYPGRSLIHNIGNDGSGTHCGPSSSMDVILCDRPIRLDGIPVEPNMAARQAIIHFYRSQTQRGPRHWIKRLLRSLSTRAEA